MMDEDNPNEEYEEIDLDSSGVPLLANSPAHGKVLSESGALTSPSRRPPMPLPGSTALTQPGVCSSDKSVTTNTGPHKPKKVQRSASRSSAPGKRPLPPPPPNKAVSESLPDQLKGPPLPSPNKGRPKHKPTGSASSDPPVSRKPPPEVPVKKVRGKSTGLLVDTGTGAPPLPPKPIDYKELEESLSPKEKKPSQEYIIDAEELSLEDFIAKYQEELPLHVRVCKGFYGLSERTSVSEGDTFNIHFIKKAQVVKIQDGCGSSYKVALNSALEFGIMYNPNKNREEALAGFKFDKVGDLFQLPVLPKVVRVIEGCKGSSSEATVENSEVLVVKGVKRRLNHKYLKAISMTSKEKKELSENCAVKLSTRPYDVRLYLPDLLDMVDNPLPSTAVLFVSSDTAHELPPNIVTSVVTLTSLSTETSLIATSTFLEDVVDALMMDIPNDLDIELQVMWPKRKEDNEQLYADTRTLIENFKPSNVSAYITNAHSDSNAQSAVYAIVKEDNEMAGVDLIKPSTIYYNSREVLKGVADAGTGKDDTALSQKRYVQRNSHGSEQPQSSSTASAITASKKFKPVAQQTFSAAGAQLGSDYVDVAETDRLNALEDRVKSIEACYRSAEEKLSHLPNFSKFESDATKVSRDITSARADMKRLEGRVVQCAEDLSATKTNVTKLGGSLQEIQRWCDTLQKAVVALQTSASNQFNGHGTSVSLRSQSSPQHSGSSNELAVYSTIPEETCQRNRGYLGTLNSMQVLTLLEQMGLKKLQDNFMAERVTGEILLECDDEVLYQELKVSSKIHRVRLMKVISGKHSAENILKGEDPYVYASVPTQ